MLSNPRLPSPHPHSLAPFNASRLAQLHTSTALPCLSPHVPSGPLARQQPHLLFCPVASSWNNMLRTHAIVCELCPHLATLPSPFSQPSPLPSSSPSRRVAHSPSSSSLVPSVQLNACAGYKIKSCHFFADQTNCETFSNRETAAHRPWVNPWTGCGHKPHAGTPLHQVWS